ncbi:MAG TPA: DNA replication/repair protein RecF [Flavobacteriales bacterium]|nr:DNA replication/repair protein RecF [Flavobacteriales bacterium]HMR28418.1 DNA replication/repair protein RecF [Flavobacteriales bacterium]
MKVRFRRLAVFQFRNHAQAELQLGPEINCFVGPNGTGKTNLLDAVHYLALCKSYFDATDQHAVRHGEEQFLLKGVLEEPEGDVELACSVRREHKKVFQRDRKEYERLSDHIGRWPAVMITPYDGQLILEGSEVRRRFVDGLIAQFDRSYLDALMRYNRALRQRNVLLKRFAEQGGGSLSALEPWDEQLVMHATTVHRGRRAFLAELTPLVLEHYQGISSGPETVGLEYRSALDEQPMDALLRSHWDRDRSAQYTTAGVHKDDLHFLLDGQPLRRFGSQGQQKTFLIALKLAQFDLTAARTGRRPVLMLDDIFDKIDPQRMRHLLRLLGGGRFGQVLITDTDAGRLHQALDGLPHDVRFFHLDHAQAIRMEAVERAEAR